MCLSAPASFIASAVLATMGIALIRRIKTWRHLPIALIPCFFAIQQLAEGMVWINLKGLPHLCWGECSKNIFLFFAYLFWPLWIPISFWVAENKNSRKQMLAACFGIALTLVCFLAFLIPYTQPVSYRFSIHYLQTAPLPWAGQIGAMGVIFYGISTLLPLFITTLKNVWILGICAALFGVAIYAIDSLLLVSLWCFFSALISISLFFILQRK